LEDTPSRGGGSSISKGIGVKKKKPHEKFQKREGRKAGGKKFRGKGTPFSGRLPKKGEKRRRGKKPSLHEKKKPKKLKLRRRKNKDKKKAKKKSRRWKKGEKRETVQGGN